MALRRPTFSTLQASGAVTTSSKGTSRLNLHTAEGAELWILVTAFTANSVIAVSFATSPNDTDWQAQKVLEITGVGIYSFIVHRASGQALGLFGRVEWEVTSGGMTFSALGTGIR